METVLDHNITSKEWKEAISIPKDIYFRHLDQTEAYKGIATLYWIRGNNKKAMEYANKLTSLVKIDLIRMFTHP